MRDRGDALVACGLVFAAAGDVLGVLPIHDVLTGLGQSWAAPDGSEENVQIAWT